MKKAIIDNNRVEVEKFLSSAADTRMAVNSLYENDNSNLIPAIEVARSEMPGDSVAADVTASQIEAAVRTPLMFVAETSHEDMAAYLVSIGANLEDADTDGFTPLIIAVMNARLNMVKYLVGIGANLEARTNSGYTPLMLAVKDGHIDIVRHLLHANANVAAQDPEGRNSFIIAVETHRTDIMKLFISLGKVFSSYGNDVTSQVAIEKLNHLCDGRSYSSNKNYYILLKIRTMLQSLDKAIISNKNRSPIRRKNLLVAGIYGVEFSEDVILRYTGMLMPKFKEVVSLMRSAKIAKIFGENKLYFTARVLMQKTKDSSILLNMPFDLMSNVMGFMPEVNILVTSSFTDAISSSGIAPAAQLPVPTVAANPSGAAAVPNNMP